MCIRDRSNLITIVTSAGAAVFVKSLSDLYNNLLTKDRWLTRKLMETNNLRYGDETGKINFII